MCGIAGIIGEPDDGWIDAEIVGRMCDAIRHRGPDDEGHFTCRGAGLGMRRLSIIDVDGGHQPIFNEDGTICVVFNGEIYNFLELSRELESRGHKLSTNTDTEVIVHLYEDFGAECVLRLRGMFAFAVFDQKQRRLLLARDRVGKKPLHYALANGRILFASEIKAILAAAPELKAIDQQALLQYFYFGYIPDPASAFSHIRKLPAGHILEFERGSAWLRQYWDFPQYGTYSPHSEEECLQQVEEKLAEAVRIRLMSDVPLGAFLSGGTDSSTLVALMTREAARPVKTFSIGFRHADFNEAPFARRVAQRFGTEHQELILEPDIEQTLEVLATIFDEPFGDSSALPTYYVSCLARKHVTVALSGDGGDEAFAGYERYQIHLRDRARYPIPAFAGRWFREHAYPRLPYGTPGRNVAYSISLPWQERYIEAVSLAPAQRNFGLLARDFVNSFDGAADPFSGFRSFLKKAPAEDPLSCALYLDSKTYLPGDILTKLDRMSMAASLEARAPFLDHVFLEFVTGLQQPWKLGRRGPKYILTRLAERLGVPREVLHRPKQGFAVPLVHWFRNELKDFLQDILLDTKTLQRGYLERQGIQRLLSEFLRGATDEYHEIWRFLMFELWYRNYVESGEKATLDRALPDISVDLHRQTA